MQDYDEAIYKFIKTIDGVLIRDPVTKVIIPKEGALVPWIGSEGRFWRRRVNDGTAIIISKASQAKAEKPTRKGGHN